MAIRSKTVLITVVVAVVAIVVAYTAAAWVIGVNVQGRLERQEQQVLTDAPYISLVKREYRRGIYGATEEATYALKSPFIPLIQALPAGQAAGPSLQLTVRNTIHHGPLPRLRSAALATIDTELTPPPALAQQVNAALGGRPPVAIRTSLTWLGGTTTNFSIPAFRAQLPAGATIAAQGVSGSGEITRNVASWTGQVSAGGVDVQAPEGSVNLSDIRFDASMRRVFDAIYVGDGHLKLASLAVRATSLAPFLMKGFSVDSSSQADREYVDYQTRVAADQLNATNFSFSHVVYSMRILHLQGSALAALTRALRQARAGAAAGDAAATQAGVTDALNQYGVELLVHDPVIQIQSLAFAMPEGEFHLAASLAAHGVRRQDLVGGLAGLIGLVRYLDASVDLRIDDALLTKLVGSNAQGPALSAQLDSLKKQGYLKQDGRAWTAQLALHAGKLTINGQAFPPAAGSS